MGSPVHPFLCITCGARRVTLRQEPGRTYTYRVFPSLPVPEDVGIPTCGRCHAVYINEQTAATLEPVLAAEYRRQLSRKAKRALADLSPFVAQRELERLLDITQGYLSRIACGHGNPARSSWSCLPCWPRTRSCLNGSRATGPSRAHRIRSRSHCDEQAVYGPRHQADVGCGSGESSRRAASLVKPRNEVPFFALGP